MLTASLRYALYPVKHLGDPVFTGALTKITNQIKEQDIVAARGMRSVFLSRHRHMLKGFQLNQRNPFDAALRHPVSVSTDRDTATATVDIPVAIPQVNLFLPKNGVFYRFVVSMGTVSDIENFGDLLHERQTGPVVYETTGWIHAGSPSEAQQVRLQIDLKPSPEDSFVLAIGLEMGMLGRFGEVEVVPKAGTAKVLEVF